MLSQCCLPACIHVICLALLEKYCIIFSSSLCTYIVFTLLHIYCMNMNDFFYKINVLGDISKAFLIVNIVVW